MLQRAMLCRESTALLDAFRKPPSPSVKIHSTAHTVLTAVHSPSNVRTDHTVRPTLRHRRRCDADFSHRSSRFRVRFRFSPHDAPPRFLVHSWSGHADMASYPAPGAYSSVDTRKRDHSHARMTNLALMSDKAFPHLWIAQCRSDLDAADVW